MKNEVNEKEPARRNFLKRTLSLLPLAAVGSSLTPFTSSAVHKSFGDAVLNSYVSTFFNHEEWEFVLAVTNRLIPDDENGPGAISEGVPVFIDKQMELPYGHGSLWYMHGPFTANALPELGYQSNLTPRETWRRGIKSVNCYCRQRFNKSFQELSYERQDDILCQLEDGRLSFEEIPGKLFFTQMLENTKEGYFADPLHGGNQTMASWRLIGFPGARADYPQVMDNPGKPYLLGPVSISGKRSV